MTCCLEGKMSYVLRTEFGTQAIRISSDDDVITPKIQWASHCNYFHCYHYYYNFITVTSNQDKVIDGKYVIHTTQRRKARHDTHLGNSTLNSLFPVSETHFHICEQGCKASTCLTCRRSELKWMLFTWDRPTGTQQGSPGVSYWEHHFINNFQP